MAGSEEINFYQELKTSISLWKKKAKSVGFFLSFIKTSILYSEKKVLVVVIKKST